MDIQSGTYYWPETMEETPSYPALDKDLTCDVLIIGAGSSGAQCAYYLAEQGLRPVIIEQEKVGSGSTSTNTTILQSSGEKYFTDLIHTFGEEAIAKHYKLCQQAIDDIEQACEKVRIDTEFKRRDTLYYVSQEGDLPAFQKEYQWLKSEGAPVEWVDSDWIREHYSFEKQGAVYVKNDGEMNPLAFTHGLIDYVHQKGAQVFEHTKMTGLHYEDGKPVIRTGQGNIIRAEKVIFAAGYNDMEIKKEKKARFVSTYTVTTAPVPDFTGWHNRTLIWETARPYVYIRSTKDNRVIIGGLDEDTNHPVERDQKMIHKRDGLLQEFHKLFPEIQVEAEYVSAAFYGGMVDGLPMIGEYPEYPNSHFLLAYGDNGIVYGMVLAKLLAQMISGDKKVDATLYQRGQS
ncbi:FAD-binding oxidoreductase [Halobacillus fulvus]|nr:FAD-binding oxidoreductase [Halobacillus fulvus]